MAYLTYFDLVENLIVSSFGGPQDAEQRDIRTAVQRAYSEVTTIREWSHYVTHGRIVTQTPYNTGTVSYTSNSRQLLLDGGTWPTWAASGSVSIGQSRAKVAQRASGTVLILDQALTFPATLAAGQPYMLYQSEYDLPSDFRDMDEPSSEFDWSAGTYLRPDDAMKLERVGNSGGHPWNWTVLKNSTGTGHVIKLVGYPTVQETLDFTYRRYPRPLRWSGHEPLARYEVLDDGSGNAQVSQSNIPPSYDTSMVGSILRVGYTDTFPGSIESMTPYVGESVISALFTDTVPNDIAVLASSVELDGGKKALVTDPADVARHMQVALHSCATYWLDRIRGGKAEQSFATYQRDLKLAMEQDQLAPWSGRSSDAWNDRGWRSPLQGDGGT